MLSYLMGKRSGLQSSMVCGLPHGSTAAVHPRWMNRSAYLVPHELLTRPATAVGQHGSSGGTSCLQMHIRLRLLSSHSPVPADLHRAFWLALLFSSDLRSLDCSSATHLDRGTLKLEGMVRPVEQERNVKSRSSTSPRASRTRPKRVDCRRSCWQSHACTSNIVLACSWYAFLLSPVIARRLGPSSSVWTMTKVQESTNFTFGPSPSMLGSRPCCCQVNQHFPTDQARGQYRTHCARCAALKDMPVQPRANAMEYGHHSPPRTSIPHAERETLP
ncbi:uncharacterized protein LAESUDRAFT_441841 [Laetiporus sulphureus 93-53]|uniref:Uncharacterized protein n=1 Tax=Laetiporus sulphureus 93-53 TaxID=1314785 RepID=A0A165C2W3_9APHY|nr:uncharacterized protein LAESUDRAFT_441841 [Laetiporus sulphureus 93-53]KZT02103.1 hypothetical protein LAESUDRAFT_441841 [Laetiporus sulphureus 93-53]